MTKNADVVDAVPPERKSPGHAMRVRILTALQPQLDAAVLAGQAISGLPLSEMVLLVLTPGMEKKVPFQMPPPMVVLDSGAKENAAEIWVLAEPRQGFGQLLQSIYSCADERSIAPYRNPLPEGYVFVVLGTPGGFVSAVFGQYVTRAAHEPGNASN